MKISENGNGHMIVDMFNANIVVKHWGLHQLNIFVHDI